MTVSFRKKTKKSLCRRAIGLPRKPRSFVLDTWLKHFNREGISITMEAMEPLLFTHQRMAEFESFRALETFRFLRSVTNLRLSLSNTRQLALAFQRYKFPIIAIKLRRVPKVSSSPTTQKGSLDPSLFYKVAINMIKITCFPRADPETNCSFGEMSKACLRLWKCWRARL